MANAFVPASNTSGQPGYAARAGMLNQVLNALSGVWEVGTPWGALQPLTNPGAVTATLVSGGGNLSAGTYQWALTANTGVLLGGTAYPSGNTTALGTVSNVVTASAGDSATISAFPTVPAGAVSWTLWRTQANGTTFYTVTTLPTTTTTYTDTMADSALGTTAAPTVNTTGTPWTVPVYPSLPGFNGTAGALAGMSVGSTTAPIWWDGVHWQQVPLWTSANTWASAQTFSAVATFSAGITGTGSVGSLTVPWSNLTSVPSLVNSVTAGSGISLSATTGSPTITNSGVLAFNGRTGDVDPASGDYTFAEIADTAANDQLAGPLVDSLTSDASTLTVTNPSGVGSANVDLNLANANTWTAAQTFTGGTTYTASGAAGSYTWQYDSTLNSLQLVYTAT